MTFRCRPEAEHAMSNAQQIPKLPKKFTEQEYLALERASQERHEYINGEIIAMAGEKLPHGIISANIVTSLGSQLKGTPCFVVTKDTKVRSGLGVVTARSVRGIFSYPDVLVVCGEPEFLDENSDVIVNPKVIVEVLSKSTELYDRSDKFEGYRTWSKTLTDYVLVAQTRAHVEHHSPNAAGRWEMQEMNSLDGEIVLASIGCTLKLADIYDRITFPEQDQVS